VPHTPSVPDFTKWPSFPFEGEFRVKALDPPVAVEPARKGEGTAECVSCNAPDDAYIWISERWRVRAMDRPTGLPMVLILESRSHLDLGDLPNLLAAELGVMTVRLERAIRSLDGVARVHVNRWGDGSAHLHMWFLARPYGRLQLRGTFLSLWDDILPPIPESQWRENLALVAAWLAEFGGRPLAEPPRIQWQAPSSLVQQATAAAEAAAAEAAAAKAAAEADAALAAAEADDAALAATVAEETAAATAAEGQPTLTDTSTDAAASAEPSASPQTSVAPQTSESRQQPASAEGPGSAQAQASVAASASAQAPAGGAPSVAAGPVAVSEAAAGSGPGRRKADDPDATGTTGHPNGAKEAARPAGAENSDGQGTAGNSGDQGEAAAVDRSGPAAGTVKTAPAEAPAAGVQMTTGAGGPVPRTDGTTTPGGTPTRP
jgi:hypothetical protein